MNQLRKLFGQRPAESPQASVTAPAAAAQETAPPKPKAGLETREMPAAKAYTMPTSRIRYGINSHIGGRGNNEDAALAMLLSAELAGDPPPIGLFAVADGLGGHQGGERASSITSRLLAQFFLNEIVTPQLEERKASGEQKTILEILIEAMAAANTAVREQASGAATTATCAVIRADLAYIAHVGDSRAYLFAEDTLEKITRDHSLKERLKELESPSEEEAAAATGRNVLWNAVGATAQLVTVDTAIHELPPAARLLLCSDGLWDAITEEEIKAILQEHADPQEACDRLIAAANANGSQDNITAVLVQMPD